MFVDGTGATPSYTQVTEEKHRGKGCTDGDYFADKFPIPDVSTQVNGAITAGDTTITVDSTAGFPSSGYIFIEDDKIAYAGKSSTTFTGCTGVSAHDDNTYVYPYGIEISTTESSSDPTWTVMDINSGYDLDLESGRFHLYDNYYTTDVYGLSHPPRIPNRVRITYLAGHDSIPLDIEWLCLALASRDLMKSAVRRAHAHGRNSFNPELIETDTEEINRILNNYRSFKIANV